MVVSYDRLERVLQLPEGHKIVGVASQTADEIGWGAISLVVVGDDMPKHIGGSPLVIVPTPDQ